MGLPGFEVTEIGATFEGRLPSVSRVRYVRYVLCALCGSSDLRDRGRRVRHLRHESIGERCCVLELETRKLRCRVCMKTFWQRFPGILPGKRSTEPFRRMVAHQHFETASIVAFE